MRLDGFGLLVEDMLRNLISTEIECGADKDRFLPFTHC